MSNVHVLNLVNQCLSSLRNSRTQVPYEKKLELSSAEFEMRPSLEIIARLRQLPEVLGKTDGEITEILGISTSLWANYKSEKVEVTIRPRVALTLWNAFGVPMEWIYDGQTNLVQDPVMRAKLTIANRKAEAWLASRVPPLHMLAAG